MNASLLPSALRTGRIKLETPLSPSTVPFRFPAKCLSCSWMSFRDKSCSSSWLPNVMAKGILRSTTGAKVRLSDSIPGLPQMISPVNSTKSGFSASNTSAIRSAATSDAALPGAQWTSVNCTILNLPFALNLSRWEDFR